MKELRYKNIKNGKTYIVLYTAFDCTANRDELMVVYIQEGHPDTIFVRERTEFYAKFTLEDNTYV